MTPVERAALAVFRLMDPERAHDLSLEALRIRLLPSPGAVTSVRLVSRVGGLTFPNPLGLAAGYDKNAVALPALTAAGFGFVEVGAVTPRQQSGNPRPRLFRLPRDRAVINRFGFNNEGAEAVAARLSLRPTRVPVGLNLGANKDSEDRAADYADVARIAAPLVDFLTVNVSSPNTERLRDLQGREALAALLSKVIDVRGATPVWLKIAPDLDDGALADVAAVAREAGVDAIVATNTTLARDGLASRNSREGGGLSGKPLFDLSTRVLARLSRLTDTPLIGVGGVSSAEDALTKIRAGASAVQLYTGLVYGGLSLARSIPEELDALLAARGFTSVAEAVGTNRDRWL